MKNTSQHAEQGLIAYRNWLAATGVSNTTGWRWARQGWIAPINIAGRLYVTHEEIKRFQERAANGEFAQAAKGAAARTGVTIENNKESNSL